MSNMKCARSACQTELHPPFMAIWNDFSVMTPRLYCMGCGRRIIFYNKRDDIVQLEYCIVEEQPQNTVEWLQSLKPKVED